MLGGLGRECSALSRNPPKGALGSLLPFSMTPLHSQSLILFSHDRLFPISLEPLVIQSTVPISNPMEGMEGHVTLVQTEIVWSGNQPGIWVQKVAVSSRKERKWETWVLPTQSRAGRGSHCLRGFFK